MQDPVYVAELETIVNDFPGLPPDVQEALAQYETDIRNGDLIPWNPDTREEYWIGRVECDSWIYEHMLSHLPLM